MHRVHPHAVDAEIPGEVHIGLECGDVGRRIVGIQEMLAPKILGKARDGEAMAGHLVLQGVPAFLGGMVLRVGIAVEAAELQTIEAEFRELGSNSVKGDWIAFIGADIIRPSADRGPFHVRSLQS